MEIPIQRCKQGDLIRAAHLKSALIEAERRFRRSCEQIVLINEKLQELQYRYNRAKKTNRRSFRYSLRLKLAATEGVRNMYLDYAHCQAARVGKLRQELFGSVNDRDDDEDSDGVVEYSDSDSEVESDEE